MDLLDKAVILRILSEMEKSQERDRRRDSFDAYQIYSGNQATYVKKELQAKRPKSYSQYVVSDINIAGMVTKKRAQSYMLPPIREIQSDKLLDKIYSDAMADRAYQAFDETFNLQKHAMMWVNWMAADKAFRFMPLHPYEFSMVRNKDDGKLEIVILNYPSRDITSNAESGDGYGDLIAESQMDSAAQSNVYVFWSKDQIVKVERSQRPVMVNNIEKLKVDVTFLPIEGNPDNVNPIGMLPFVYLSDDLSVDLPTKNPLADQSVTFNYQWSEVMTAANLQGSGQFVISYPEQQVGKLDNLSTGLTSAIELPQMENMPATTAQYINPSPDLAGQKDVAITYLKKILKEHGLEGENMELGESSAVSGISKAISGSSVQKIIAKNQMLYEKVEMKVFEIVKAYLDVARISSMTFGADEGLRVVYPKPKVMISDRETLENIKMKMEMGLIEKWEALVALDPNLTEDEAREKLLKIEQERLGNISGLLNGVQPGRGNEETQDQS